MLGSAANSSNLGTVYSPASPFDFNGMVRHYYMRHGPNQADLRINLVPKDDRAQGSHAIALRVRPLVEKIARARRAPRPVSPAPSSTRPAPPTATAPCARR